MYVVGPVAREDAEELGVAVAVAEADDALVVGLSEGGCEKTPGGKARVGVTDVDARVDAVGAAGAEVSVVEVIPVAEAIVGLTTALAAGTGVLMVVTFWGGGVDSGPAGFSRVHPMAAIANNARVAKK